MKKILENKVLIIGVVAVVALIVSLFGGKGIAQKSVAQKVLDSGEIKLGYMIGAPYLMKDEKTGKLSGVSYDIVEAAAKKLNLKTVWTEEVGWGTAIEGLKNHRYDMTGTQMWPTAERAREATFTKSIFNSVVYPYVKTGDQRFTNNLSRLNSSQYTISTLDGEMSSTIARDDYPNANTNALPQMASFSELFLNILNGKADITFLDPTVAKEFAKTNPGKIQRASELPVRTFGNTFVFARGEDEMAGMLNVALTELINDGTIQKILEKYNVADEYKINK